MMETYDAQKDNLRNRNGKVSQQKLRIQGSRKQLPPTTFFLLFWYQNNNLVISFWASHGIQFSCNQTLFTLNVFMDNIMPCHDHVYMQGHVKTHTQTYQILCVWIDTHKRYIVQMHACILTYIHSY